MNDKKKTEEEIKKELEESNKKMLSLEIVIGSISITSFLIMLFVAILAVESFIWSSILIVSAIIIFMIGIIFALKIETEAGYYECQKCHNKYVPKYNSVIWAMHVGRTRYMKCPKCKEKSWNKKVLSR